MEKQENGEKWMSRCFSPSGLITYTAEGYMAVGINCMTALNSAEPTTEPKDMIFYTGTYRLEDGKVVHHVMNSADPIFYKKDLSRDVVFNSDGTITLTGKGKTGSPVRLIWKKLSE